MKLIKGYYLNEQRMDLKINMTRRANSLCSSFYWFTQFDQRTR